MSRISAQINAHPNVLAAILVGMLYVAYVAMYLIPLQTYAYYGTYNLDANIVVLISGLIVSIVLAAFLSTETSASMLFLWFVFLTMVIPRFVQAGCRNDELWYTLLCLATFVVVAFLESKLREWSLPTGMSKPFKSGGVSLAFVGVLLAAAVVLVLYMLATIGIPSLEAFDYTKTYEIREAQSFDFVESAVLSLAGSRILPVLICFLLVAGAPWLALIATIAEIALFLWTANKAWLLLVVLAWALYALNVKGKLTVLCCLAIYVALMCVIAVASCILPDSIPLIAFSFFVRRLIFVPASIGDGYFHFFQDGNPLVLLQNTVLGSLTPMPQQYADVDYTVQIGQYLYGEDVVTVANSGLFGGEIASFGPYLSFIVIAVNMLIICKLFKYDGGTVSVSLACLMTVMFAFLLINASSIRLLFSPTGLVGTLVIIALMLFADAFHATMKGRPSLLGKARSQSQARTRS